jgi:hypothetical protein
VVPTSEDERQTGQPGFGWFGWIVTAVLVGVAVMAVATAVLVEPGAGTLAIAALGLLGLWVWSTAEL